MRLSGLLLVAALLAAPDAASADPGRVDVPFRVTGSGTTTLTLSPTLGGTARGTAVGPYIGAGTLSASYSLPRAAPPCGSGTAPETLSIILTAANRDELNETVSASACSSAPNTFDATGTYTISGGTGRFAAASGAGTWSSEASFSRGFNRGTFTTVQAGTISFRDSPGPSVRPTISGLSETRSTFAPSTAHHAGGTLFSVRIDQPATVTIEIELRAPGRRAGGVCRPPFPRLHHNPPCTRTVPIGTLAKQASPGLAKITFSGRIHGHALKPGRYVAIFTATNSVGRSTPHSLRFTVT